MSLDFDKTEDARTALESVERIVKSADFQAAAVSHRAKLKGLFPQQATVSADSFDKSMDALVKAMVEGLKE